MEVPAGFAARRDGHQRRGDVRHTRRIGDSLPDNRLVAGQDRRQQRFVLIDSRRCFLGTSRRDECRHAEKDRCRGRAHNKHSKLRSVMCLLALARLKVRRSR
jgi:hypothetical protein